MNSRRRVTAALIGLLVLVAGGWFGNQALLSPPTGGPFGGGRSGLVAEVWQLIQHGGPFPHRQDGTVFGNREGQLPQRQSRFYREYTVPPPGEPDWGARRLVTGGTAELYYTGDHCVSFVVVDPQR